MQQHLAQYFPESPLVKPFIYICLFKTVKFAKFSDMYCSVADNCIVSPEEKQ